MDFLVKILLKLIKIGVQSREEVIDLNVHNKYKCKSIRWVKFLTFIALLERICLFSFYKNTCKDLFSANFKTNEEVTLFNMNALLLQLNFARWEYLPNLALLSFVNLTNSCYKY